MDQSGELISTQKHFSDKELKEAAFYFEQIEKDLRPLTPGGGAGVGFTEGVGSMMKVESEAERKERDLLLRFSEWMADNVDVEQNGLANDMRALFMGRLPDGEHARELTEWFATFLNEQNISLRDRLKYLRI